MTLRAFAPPDAWSDTEILLDAEEARHVLRALRARPDEPVLVVDGAGRTAAACLDGPRARIQRQWRQPPPQPAITLAPALLKNENMDWVMQKAVELGAAAVAPLACDHCVVELKADRAEHRRARWEKIMRQAAAQAGNPWVPVLHAPASLAQRLAASAGQPVLWCALAADAPLLRDVARRFPTPPPAITLLVGPEGDFSAAEMECLRAGGAQPVSLGALVLRAETATLAALAALRYEWAAPPGMCAVPAALP